jgi:hypothetical protein
VSLSANGRAAREKVNTKHNKVFTLKTLNTKNVNLIILLLCFVFGGSNDDHRAQVDCHLAFGWVTVSKVPKLSDDCFYYESTKKKKRFF